MPSRGTGEVRTGDDMGCLKDAEFAADGHDAEPGGPVPMTPVRFRTVAALGSAIAAYFEECDNGNRPYTVSGLAASLGMTRQELLAFDDSRAAMNRAVGLALTRCEAYAEEALYTGKASGASFSLKNNFNGWKDKSEPAREQKSDLEARIAEAEERLKNRDSIQS